MRARLAVLVVATLVARTATADDDKPVWPRSINFTNLGVYGGSASSTSSNEAHKGTAFGGIIDLSILAGFALGSKSKFRVSDSQRLHIGNLMGTYTIGAAGAYSITDDIEVGARVNFEYLAMLGASRKGAAAMLEGRWQRVTATLDFGPGYGGNAAHFGVAVRGMILENWGAIAFYDRVTQTDNSALKLTETGQAFRLAAVFVL